MTKEELLKNPIVREIAIEFDKRRNPWMGSEEYWDFFVKENTPKKEWEIISWRYKKDHDIVDVNFTGHLANMDHWDIYSVKRLSDGEIFKIGDNISLTNSINPLSKNKYIKEFIQLENNKMSVVHCIGTSDILNIQKMPEKKVSFISEDGVNVFEGDEFYPVYNFNLQHKNISKIYHCQEEARKNGYLWFSHEKAAKEYIIHHKPCLSLIDVQYYLVQGCDRNPSKTNGSKTLSLLRDYIKKKLND